MFNPIVRKGFCPACVQNIRQKREIHSGFWRFLDLITLRAGSLIQLGPWKCTYCGSIKYFLPATVRGMRDYDAEIERYKKMESELPVGNFIVDKVSLAARQDNTDRFSEKYRNGVVQKILKGQTTISQVCTDINIAEPDVISWISNFVDNQNRWMQEQIDQLKLFISESPSLAIESESISKARSEIDTVDSVDLLKQPPTLDESPGNQQDSSETQSFRADNRVDDADSEYKVLEGIVRKTNKP
jgi:transposase-like protein